MFLKNVNDIRLIEWGKTHLWDVNFINEDIPAPFDKFFPAIDIQEPLASLQTFPVGLAQTDLSIPQKSSLHKLNMTFPDDESGTLSSWMQEWINTIILGNEQGFVATIEESVKQLMVVKLKSNREQAKTPVTYYVYPEGELLFAGNSESGAVMYTMSFDVAGIASK